MIKFRIGQTLWDEKSCAEIEVVNFNGVDYYCKTTEGASDEDEGTEGYQWFKASELISIE